MTRYVEKFSDSDVRSGLVIVQHFCCLASSGFAGFTGVSIVKQAAIATKEAAKERLVEV